MSSGHSNCFLLGHVALLCTGHLVSWGTLPSCAQGTLSLGARCPPVHRAPCLLGHVVLLCTGHLVSWGTLPSCAQGTLSLGARCPPVHRAPCLLGHVVIPCKAPCTLSFRGTLFLRALSLPGQVVLSGARWPPNPSFSLTTVKRV